MSSIVSIKRSVDTIPRTAVALRKRALALGWRTDTLCSVVAEPDTFFVSGEKVGELKKAAHEETHHWLAARSPLAELGFLSHWVDGKWDHARVIDPVGQPIELYFEYKPIASLMARDPKETEDSWAQRVSRAKRMAEEQNADYNDGTQWIVKEYIIDSATEFKDWLSGWEELLEGVAA